MTHKALATPARCGSDAVGGGGFSGGNLGLGGLGFVGILFRPTFCMIRLQAIAENARLLSGFLSPIRSRTGSWQERRTQEKHV